MKSIEKADSLLKFVLLEFGRFRWGMLLAVIRSIVVAPLPLLFGAMIDVHLPSGSVYGIVVTALIFVSLLMIHTGCAIGAARMLGYAITTLVRDIRSRVFNRMQFLSFGYLDQSTTGRLLSKYAFDSQKVQDVMLNILNNIIPAIFSGLSVTILMLILNWRLAAVALIIIPLLHVTRELFKKRLHQKNREMRLAQESLTGSANEMISALPLVRSLGEERKAEHRLSSFNLRLAEARFGLFSMGSVFGTFLFVSNSVVSLFVVSIGAYMVLEGYLTIGALFAFVAALPIIMQPFTMIAQSLEQYMVGQEAFTSIRELVACDYVENWKGKTVLSPMRADIRFIDADFAYPGKEDQLIFKDFNLRIRSGESVALVGASGSGKSTLANLVLGLYSLKRGQIEIDGVPLEQLDMRKMRQRCAIVMQDNILLSGSILDNIRFARERSTNEEVIAAAKAANADEFIRDLPDGYDTVIGERGVSLSGGQRQRISIARAILRDPQLLILDEATSALDNESEAQIQEALDRLSRGRTVITIAHRLSTIRNADRIVVLGKGKILEQGSFEELATIGGHFSRLLDSQIATSSSLALAAGKREGEANPAA